MDSLLSLDIGDSVLDFPDSNVPYPFRGVNEGGWDGGKGGEDGRWGWSGNLDWYLT